MSLKRRRSHTRKRSEKPRSDERSRTLPSKSTKPLDTTPPEAKEFYSGTRPVVKRVRELFSASVVSIPDSRLNKVLTTILDSTVKRTKPSPSFNKLMEIIEKKIDHRPEWQKFFIRKGFKYVWIGLRISSPHFATMEKITDEYYSKSIRRKAKGIIELVDEDYFTVLYELLESDED